MPKHSRNVWACRRCGQVLAFAQFQAAVIHTADRQRATYPPDVRRPMLVVCGGCRAYHEEDPEGVIRLMTSVEELAVRVANERDTDACDALQAAGLPVGLAIVPEPKSPEGS